jgi:hypothetical protein
LQGLSNLQFIKDFHQAMFIFNEGPANNFSFIIYIRKYHSLLLMSFYLLYLLAVTYFAEDFFLSYVLGFLAFICLVFYLGQFLVYIHAYVEKAI